MSGVGHDRIVSSGRAELLKSPEYALAVEEVRARVTDEFAPRIVHAGFLHRHVLLVQMWWRTRREVEALAPPEALYTSPHGSGRRHS